MMSGNSAATADSNPCNVSTRRQVCSMPPENSSSIARSASVALSSTIRIDKGRDIFSRLLLRDWKSPHGLDTAGRRLIQYRPESAELLYSPNKLFEANRFNHVCVHPQFIAAHDVRFLAGTGKDDDGNVLQIRFGANPLQHLEPVPFGELDVQQNDCRIPPLALLPCSFTSQVIDGLSAVAQRDDFVDEARLLERNQSKLQISGIIFYQNNRFKQLHLEIPPWLRAA